MSEQNAVPLVVVSAAREPVETINSLLRRAGEPVHCTWLAGTHDLAQAVAQLDPQLIVLVGSAQEELQVVLDIRARIAARTPVLLVSESNLDETRIADAMVTGARDAVSLGNPARLQSVMLRELGTFRLERALKAAVSSACDARSQLASLLERSNDAIAQAQEGILVGANPAWLELLGVNDSIIGEPVMDLFAEPTQEPLRVALSACLQGRGNERTVKAQARRGDGSLLPLEMVLAPGEHEGERCVRLIVPAADARERSPSTPAAPEAAQADPVTGLLHRRYLLQALEQRVARPAAGAVRCLAYIQIEQPQLLERTVGITGIETVLAQLARRLNETLLPGELAGRFGDAQLLVLLERGNEREITLWAQQLSARLRKHVMRIKDQTVSAACMIGLCGVAAERTLDATIGTARERSRNSARGEGSPAVAAQGSAAADPPPVDDKSWVKQIRAALLENRFRLVQLPIASLQGGDVSMFDVLVRMIDAGGQEILPAQFMPAAERHDLPKYIDRWVVGASLSFAAHRQPGCLFVRLSRDTARDVSFISWLDNHMQPERVQPYRLCFQVTEEVAVNDLEQVCVLAAALRDRGFRFALEAFGSRDESAGLLEQVPLDFIKIDAALIQGLKRDAALQVHVRLLVETAAQRLIQAIGEQVEDAETMAMLWETGAQYAQGYFVGEPQQAAQRAAR